MKKIVFFAASTALVVAEKYGETDDFARINERKLAPVADGKTFKLVTTVHESTGDQCNSAADAQTTTEKVYKVGECIPDPTPASTKWLKIPGDYECVATPLTKLTAKTYKADTCTAETDVAGTVDLAQAGACATHNSKDQTVTCEASSANGDFVKAGNTFKMVTKVYPQSTTCDNDPTITEMVYKAGDCIPSPKTAATWVKVPLYDCGSNAALTGSTYLICVLLLTLQLSSFLICAGVGSLS